MSPAAQPPDDSVDRRRDDRRATFVRLADFTIPEVRKALVTTPPLIGIAALFAPPTAAG
ncbi:MAG TPA: hypothetical protein VMM12_16690 [Longimicrobiales bacterium]|nr:hypothetical protein [Longimicrobiales bacterium]